jgi:hypothetical protein
MENNSRIKSVPEQRIGSTRTLDLIIYLGVACKKYLHESLKPLAKKIESAIYFISAMGFSFSQ